MERLPGGLDGYVGEQGQRLSGGERQRLAVARALLKDAPLLVLDEATANLDTVTERELIGTIRDLMRVRPRSRSPTGSSRWRRWTRSWCSTRAASSSAAPTKLVQRDGLYRRMLDVQDGMLMTG